tara:strand:- start:366 stop:641 length:276 start_codon:yes stop_codon:yes gene_type:complete
MTKKYVNGVLMDLTPEEEIQLENDKKNHTSKDEIIVEQPPYKEQRRNAYPEIEDQLDMLWHSIDQDPQLKSKYFDFYEAIKAVKVKYPKNG